MKRSLKKALSVFLSLLMLLSLFGGLKIGTVVPAQAVSVGTYCATAAAQWAETHWEEYSSCLLGTN